MLNKIVRGLVYFVPRLTGYGMLLGALFGALTYPVFGALVGLPWGLAAGIGLGAILGIGVPIYEAFARDKENLQQRLTLFSGLFTLVLTALPLLFVYAPVAALTVAYVTHNYADSGSAHARQSKRKNDQLGDHHQRREGVVGQVSSAVLKSSRWVIGLGVVGAIVLYNLTQANSGIPYNPLLESLMIGVIGVMYGGFMATVIAAINGLFVAFLNQLYFRVDMAHQAYKTQVMVMVGVLTLFLSSIVTLGIGAPFAAVAAALGAGKYADWYYSDDVAYNRARKRLEDHAQDDVESGFYDDEFYDEGDDLRHEPSVWDMAEQVDERH